MSKWTSFVAAWLLAVMLVTPAWARTVRIETTVPLTDHSEEALNRAMRQAVAKSVQGATAIGMSRMRIDGAWVLPDTLVLWMVATDGDSDDDDDGTDSDGPTML
jgi:hypothetical protein